jgi:hypothetical protein
LEEQNKRVLDQYKQTFLEKCKTLLKM